MSVAGAVRRWLVGAVGRDDVERREAILLQTILLVLIAVVAILALGAIVVPDGDPGTGLLALVLLEPLFLIPLWLLRSGHFPVAATATVAVFEFLVVAAALAPGPVTPGLGAAFTIPMTIAALVLRRPGLVVVTAIAISAIIVSRLLPDHAIGSVNGTINLILELAVLGVVLDRFGVSLRDALGRELAHHRELEQTKEELSRRAAELSVTNARLTREQADREAAEEARRAIEAKVLEVQKLESLGVLAGGIAHDFNNLLVAVMGNAGLALLDLPEDSPARSSIADIETAGRRAGELARQMLAYSGRSRGLVEPIELSELIHELLALLQVSIGKGVELRLQLPETPLVVDGDPAQLRQVVMNLVINAADAIGRTSSGTVSIRAQLLHASAEYLADVHPEAGLAPGPYASLEVADTGIGMDPATRDRIFDPFFTTKDTGRGLGLAAVLGIVHRHGGAIRVYSELGHGTTFRILLPVSAAVPVVAPDLDGDWRGEGTVLVVDDDPGVRRVACRLLETFGLTVRTAASGAEAIGIVEADPDACDAVLLDLTMPEMSGTEAFDRLQAIRPGLPVVLMSGYHEEELRRELDARISGFIQKPFTPGDLARKIRMALGAIEQAGGERRETAEPAAAGTPGLVGSVGADFAASAGAEPESAEVTTPTGAPPAG
jgi:signal transduction histidine kinase/AmiR/NasT family two-component response regulator